MDIKIVIFIFSTLFSISNTSFNRNDSFMTGKIVGGIEVSISMYPHVVSMGFSGFTFCGGSIIADRVVLTAAHCLQVQKYEGFTLSPIEAKIYAGTSVPGRGKTYKICRLLPHPKYQQDVSLDYDIGLIFTTKRFKYNAVVQRIGIAPDNRWKNTHSKFVVAGFGIISTHGAELAQHLSATRLFFVNSKTCEKSQSRLKFSIKVPRHGFCLIGQKWTGDCMGDSGSGVVWKNYIVGVVASGRDLYCGSDMTPSMYTNAVYFKKWIRSEIKKFDPRTCGNKEVDQTRARWRGQLMTIYLT